MVDFYFQEHALDIKKYLIAFKKYPKALDFSLFQH